MIVKKLLAFILACVFLTLSLVSCTKKDYVAELEALKEEVATLRKIVDRLDNPPQEFLDKINQLSANIDALEPKGKKFTDTVSEYRESITTFTALSNDLWINERLEDASEESNYVALRVEGYGTILIELFPDVAPITVENFKKLVSENFYDGLIFHRVIKDFMILGGDP